MIVHGNTISNSLKNAKIPVGNKSVRLVSERGFCILYTKIRTVTNCTRKILFLQFIYPHDSPVLVKMWRNCHFSFKITFDDKRLYLGSQPIFCMVGAFRMRLSRSSTEVRVTLVLRSSSVQLICNDCRPYMLTGSRRTGGGV